MYPGLTLGHYRRSQLLGWIAHLQYGAGNRGWRHATAAILSAKCRLCYRRLGGYRAKRRYHQRILDGLSNGPKLAGAMSGNATVDDDTVDGDDDDCDESDFDDSGSDSDIEDED